MQITSTTTNPGTQGFDFVNELTFATPPGFGAIASSPSVSLISDSFFVDGDDIDGDGDSDVSASLTTCGDADNDGDIEFPEGFYPAGTILDNDVQFNAALAFTVGDANLNTTSGSVDLVTVATHEFGHSHGLSHTAINQVSDIDGSGSTMYPFIDTGDPQDQINGRSLHTDDIASSSYFYPEGTLEANAVIDPADPAYVGPGDVAFTDAYSVIRGGVRDPFGGIVGGASTWAEDLNGNVAVTAITGRGQLGFDLATGGLFLLDLADSFTTDQYILPVPKGRYKVGLEALDGFPTAGDRINLTGVIGTLYGLQNFDEEYWNARNESFEEIWTGQQPTVVAFRGRSNIDFVTNFNVGLTNSNAIDGFSFMPLDGYIAVRIPLSQVQGVDFGNGVYIHAMTFPTISFDASQVPVFEAAYLAAGVDNGDGTASIDLQNPLETEAPYVGQSEDDGPVHFNRSIALGLQTLRLLANRGQELFMVLKAGPNPLPGANGFPPAYGVDVIDPSLGEVNFGTSYFSVDGGVTFNNIGNFNVPFRLVVGPRL